MSRVATVGAVLFAVAILFSMLWLWRSSGKRDGQGERGATDLATTGHIGRFLAGVLLVLVVVASLVFVSDAAYRPLQDSLFTSASSDERIGVEDFLSILALVTGVPVAFAGSMYAIYLAILGLKGAAAQERLARQANTYSDPAYELSHRAYTAYRQYGFLMGALLASQRISQQQRDAAWYLGADAEKLPANTSWDEIRLRLRELLFNEGFAVAALEAAREYGRRTSGMTQGEAEHNLRLAFSRLISHLGADASKDASNLDMVGIMSAAYALDLEIIRGREAVQAAAAEAGSATGEGQAERRFLDYLGEWMGRIDTVQTGRDLAQAVRSSTLLAEDWISPLEDPATEFRTMISSQAEQVISASEGKGAIRGISIKALMGDHQTVLAVEEVMAAAAKRAGQEPVRFQLRGLGELKAGSKTFSIITCTPTSLASYFGKGRGAFPKDFLGCIIVDGLRERSAISLEEQLAGFENDWSACMDRSRAAGDNERYAPSRLVAFTHVLEGRVATDVYRMARDQNTRISVLWVGIDYVHVGEPEISREGSDHLLELRGFFGDCGRTVSDDLRALALAGRG